MPRTCTVCGHEDRAAIDAALVAGTALRDVARRHAVSKDALFRHRDSHLPVSLTRARDAADVAQADDLLAQLRALLAKANALLANAETAGDIRTALAGVREARATLELLAELEGELDRRQTVNVLVAPEWIVVRSAVLDALAPYPDARAAVSDRLVALGAGT